MQLKNREEMNSDYLWNLSDIYKTRTDFEEASEKAKLAIGNIEKIRGTLSLSVQSLKTAYDTVYDAAQKTELVYIYAFLQKSGNNGDPVYQDMYSKAMNLYVSLQTATSFFDPELLSIEETKLKEYLVSPILEKYHHTLEDTVRRKPHTLDEKSEKMLAGLADIANSPENIFEMLQSVDMSFPKTTDDNGDEKELTHGNFSVFRESRKQSVRKESFEKYFGEFKRYINTFSASYSASVKFNNYFASEKNYGSALEKALFSSNVPLSVYDSLVKAVNDNLPTMERYLKLRKSALGLEEINMYDLYCPMVKNVEYHITYEEAKKLVKEATKPLGAEYGKLLDMAFENKWIDVYENRGKTTGAYSCGVYGIHPYVLLNFSDSFDDIFTLAHELGHAMHSYLSSKAQDYANSDYKILVAEVASTVNEVLMTKYLLSKETDKSKRAYIINHFLEGFRTTVFRQTLFAQFEKEVHVMCQNGESLTAESLSAVYRKLNETYYKGAIINELQDIEWARIPHFYNAFYVYQYATGFCSAVAIAENILETGNADNYLNFLKTGGSDYPIEELKIAGVDLTKPETFEKALKMFDDSLKELSNIIG